MRAEDETAFYNPADFGENCAFGADYFVGILDTADSLAFDAAPTTTHVLSYAPGRTWPPAISAPSAGSYSRWRGLPSKSAPPKCALNWLGARMIFNKEAVVIAHLVTTCAPSSVILGTLDAIDLTDDTTSPVVSQVSLVQIQSAGNVRGRRRRASAIRLLGLLRHPASQRRAENRRRNAVRNCRQGAGDFRAIPQQHLQITDGQPRDSTAGLSGCRSDFPSRLT